jgi:hypothetical protein
VLCALRAFMFVMTCTYVYHVPMIQKYLFTASSISSLSMYLVTICPLNYALCSKMLELGLVLVSSTLRV